MTSDIDVYVNIRDYGSYNAMQHYQLLYQGYALLWMWYLSLVHT